MNRQSLGKDLEPRQHPQHHQHNIAGRKRQQALNDVVVGAVDEAVQHPQADIRPGCHEHGRRGAARDIDEHAGNVEQHRQLQQVHVVAVGQADVRWHADGFTVLEIVGHHLAAESGTKARNGDEQQDKAGPERQDKQRLKDVGVGHVRGSLCGWNLVCWWSQPAVRLHQ